MSVAPLKLPANTTFKIKSSSGQFVTIQGGGVGLSSSGSTFVYDPSNLSVQDTGSGQFIGLDGSGNIVASSTPTPWTIIDNGDGTFSFQSNATGLFASAATSGVSVATAKTVSANQNFTFVTS